MLYISKKFYPTRADFLKMYPNEKVVLEDKNFWKISSGSYKKEVKNGKMLKKS